MSDVESEEERIDEAPHYGCNCVLPEQHCLDCEVAAARLYDDEELPF